VKIRVYHAYYGCDCGCCGHRIEFYPDSDDGCYQGWVFDHAPPDPGEQKPWARKLAEDFIWDNHPSYLPAIDWETLETDVVSDENCCF